MTQLEAKGDGCWMDGQYMGGLAYADDVILLAPCRKALLSMLDINFVLHLLMNSM
jgi:hypothetical protein